jgi:prepilin signal peptidase PulO-like enzyme (type II secretory pathway)
MNKANLIKILVSVAAVFIGVIQGNGAVYFFNKIPSKWLCDYGEKPEGELADPYAQRIKSRPWKYLFSMLFVILNIWMFNDDIMFALASSAAIWVLLEIALSDIKYRIIPDQFIMLLLVSTIGFLPYYASIRENFFGAIIGFAFTGAIALIGKLAYRRMALGGGDIKLMTCCGFLSGPAGILFIIILSTLISAGHFVFLLAKKKISVKDTRPLAPYIGFAAGVYIVFFWNLDFTGLAL